METSSMKAMLFLSAALLATPCIAAPKLFPANGAKSVNPDTQLVLTFDSAPKVGSSGKIQILDAADNSVVDTLDLAIPASPVPDGRPKSATGETKAPVPPKPAGPDTTDFQANQVGGAWFHYFPVTAKGNTAAIHPHNGALKYGKTYVVKLDPQVLTTADGKPLEPAKSWTFTTKPAPPKADAARVVVSADGKGDFNTVQGAIDFAPTTSTKPLTIFIKNGDYQEIVYLKGKSNLTVRGESREGVVVHYPNNSAFNRIRPAFTVTEANDIQLSTLTIKNDFIGQAEALLMRGDRNIIDRVTLNGSGDAFTTYGSIYMVDSTLTGDGDTILAYAALYCLRCTIKSVGPFTWTRTPKGQHGNVFINSTFLYDDRALPWSITPANPEGRKTPGVLARLPRNGAATSSYANFPYAEMVLIDSKTDGVPPEGWGPIEDQPALDWSTLRFMEFNSKDLKGRPIDLTQRHAAVRRLDAVKDAALIGQYRQPEFVLGWKPVVRP
jgi:pectinesterase